MANDGMRSEHDSMGVVLVPATALWQAQTQRAIENFPLSGVTVDPALIAALGAIKAAAASANADLGVLDREVADAIEAAAEEVAAGEHDDAFPVDVFQTGSGTSTNMNANEVIATLAARTLGRSVHPNDDVNASQSSNDVFPSAIHLAATRSIVVSLIPALRQLEESLARKSREWDDVVKSGRTHLMDATPVTLGQEFGGYAAAVSNGVERLESALPRIAELPLGGTAVGTGINAPPGFAAAVIDRLVDRTGLALTEARNHFEAQGARDALVEASGQLRTVATTLFKIANDLRWMSSGPTAGLAEIRLPDLQPGSSIMPGKVNPVVPEAVCQIVAQVYGNDAAIAFGGSAGNFELNVMLPVIGRCLLESIRLLANGSRLLADRCIDGTTADRARCRSFAESSPSIVTPLARFIGYDNAAKAAKKALTDGITVRDAVTTLGFIGTGEGKISASDLDEALDVLAMAYPHGR